MVRPSGVTSTESHDPSSVSMATLRATSSERSRVRVGCAATDAGDGAGFCAGAGDPASVETIARVATNTGERIATSGSACWASKMGWAIPFRYVSHSVGRVWYGESLGERPRAVHSRPRQFPRRPETGQATTPAVDAFGAICEISEICVRQWQFAVFHPRLNVDRCLTCRRAGRWRYRAGRGWRAWQSPVGCRSGRRQPRADFAHLGRSFDEIGIRPQFRAILPRVSRCRPVAVAALAAMPGLTRRRSATRS